MEQNEFDEKIKYAQNIINILQTRLNEAIAQNVQLEGFVAIAGSLAFLVTEDNPVIAVPEQAGIFALESS